MKTPTIVPSMVPTPPASEVPPITTPAIASSSKPLPVFGCAVVNTAT